MWITKRLKAFTVKGFVSLLLLMTPPVTDIDYKVLYEDLELKYTDLKLQLEQIKKLVFGKKSERFLPADPKETLQLNLELDATTIAYCKLSEDKPVTYTRTKAQAFTPPAKHPGRTKLPEHLRREVKILLPNMDVSNLERIGDEITEILNYTPGELFVQQYIRPKYAIPVSETQTTVIVAELPGRIMEKCMAGEGLLAQIVVDKYCDHLPLYRQLQRFSRNPITIAPSTIGDWVKTVLNHLGALYEVHKRQVLQCGYLHADETPLKVLDDTKKGNTHRGYYWVYHNSKDKLILFDYHPHRDTVVPVDMLKGYQGYLQTDGYVAYDDFDNTKGVIHLHCMAHARRKFSEAISNDPARAEHALVLFGKLYDIERQLKQANAAAEVILKHRKEDAMPILQELEAWMKQQLLSGQVLPKSAIGKAIAYCLPRWAKLSIYTTDAQLNIDNNPVENAIRPVAIGKKNYLFAGSHDAAQRAAMVYSLFATCRTHGINPYEWLKDVLINMHNYTTANIDQLLPQNWKPIQL